MKEPSRELLDAIRRSRSVMVACHIHPDGDAIGSLLAVGLGLRKLAKLVSLVSADGVPERFRFLPLAQEVSMHGCGDCDLAITLDAASVDQLGSSFQELRKCETLLKIDHHAEGEDYGDIAWLDVDAAAVGEMLVSLFRRLNVPLDIEIAQCLLTAIVTDTGSFRFANTRPSTFTAAGELLATGVPFAQLVERIYWDKPLSSAKLTGIVMSRACVLGGGTVVWSYLTNDDFIEANGNASDVDHLSNELRSIDGVKAAVLLRETKDGEIRVSLRSRNGVDVAAVAQKFGGGGHRNAAGCRIDGSEQTRKEILTETLSAVEGCQSCSESTGKDKS